jgi:hypothetical protein
MRSLQLLIFVISMLLLSSCALVFNKPYKSVKVFADANQQVVYKQDTVPVHNGAVHLMAKRSKEPLIFQVQNDTATHQVIVMPKLSTTFWLNLYFTSGYGMIVDAFTPKRFNYASPISIHHLQSDTIIHRNMNNVFARKSSAPQQEGVHILKGAPLRLFNFLQPSLELSYEMRHNKTLATQLTAAIMYPKGYRLALEEKFYLKKTAPFGTYVSLGVDFHQNQFKRVNKYIDSDLWADTLRTWVAPDSVMYEDSVTVQRKVFSANLKLGYQGGKGHFVYDVYVGVGYRYRDVVHWDRINPLDKELSYRHPNIYMTMDEGRFSTPNVTMGFRIGYVFPVSKKKIVQESFE